MNRPVLTLALLTTTPPVVAAQSPWVPPPEGRHVAIDLLKPHFQSSGVSGAVLFFSVNWPFAGGLRLVGELPVTRAKVELFATSETQTALGNPYLGVEWERSGLVVTFGGRAPLADADNDNALQAGLFTDFDRAAAFQTDVVPITASAGYRVRAGRFAFRASLGPELWWNTSSALGEDDVELLARYAMQAWYDGPLVGIGGGFRGLTIVTEDLGGVGERTFDQVGAFVRLTLGNVRPAFHVQIPLDNGLNSEVGIVYGLSVAVGLP